MFIVFLSLPPPSLLHPGLSVWSSKRSRSSTHLSSTAILKMSHPLDPFSKIALFWTPSFTTRVGLWSPVTCSSFLSSMVLPALRCFLPRQNTLSYCLCLMHKSHSVSIWQFILVLKSRLLGKKERVWSFIALLYSTELLLNLCAPAQIAFLNLGACSSQRTWAQLGC